MSENQAIDETGAVEARPEPDLPSLTAGKLCHDFIGQVGAIVSGLDLLEDESAADMRDDALAMIATSARKLAALMEFDRVAYGASGGADIFATAELERLTQGVFGHMKAELDWRVEPEQIGKAPAKVTMNLCQIAGASLIVGGQVKVRGLVADQRFALQIEATGQKVRLKGEAMAGLKGEGYGDGLAGQWIQSALIHKMIAGSGGRIAIDLEEGRLLIVCEMDA